MQNTWNLNDAAVDYALLEKVNPVFNTAKMTLFQLAANGDEDAAMLSKRMGLTLEATQNSATTKASPEQVLGGTIMLEIRYRTMARLAKESGYTLVDLPCGYTSRGIRMSRQGRTYLGFDLPAVIDAMVPAVAGIIGKSESVSYHAVDATNYESMAAPLTGNGPLLVTTEGLLMYFVQSELETVFANIHRLLQKHGGSWVITDRAYFLHDREIVAAALNNDPQLTAMYAAVTNRAAATTADVKFNDSVFFDPDDAKVRAFIGRMGFELNEICMGDYLPDEIGSLRQSPEAEPAVREVFRKMMFWELTVAEQSAAKPAPVDANLPFRVECSVKDGTFEVSIQGRMDTITAPELLKRFQEAGSGVRAIHIDVRRMSYVSSAGLRVLLMMYKSLKDKDGFAMTGVSDAVREILETTGFDQFLLKG